MINLIRKFIMNTWSPILTLFPLMLTLFPLMFILDDFGKYIVLMVFCVWALIILSVHSWRVILLRRKLKKLGYVHRATTR